MQKRSGLYLSLIIVVAIVAGFFVYPGNSVSNWRPWRLGLDLVGGSHLIYRVDLNEVDQGDQESVLDGLRDVIERRVNLFGVSEPQVFIAESGDESHLVVELAGVKEISEAINQIGETPALDFREVVLADPEEGSEEQSVNFVPTELTGRFLSGASLAFDQTTNSPQINFSLNDEGAELFQEITARNIGDPLCIFIDGMPIIEDDIGSSCPTVQAEIPGGEAVITGSFTIQEARNLIQRFNAGALPAPITLINQQTVSPTLGAESLERGIFAGAIGTILVALFMMYYYRRLGLGVFAAVALAIYIVLTLGVFKLVPITLTLAGLAGFILTIGMAVDANILIFERVKEELRKGLSVQASLTEGFRHAWPSIRDSNFATILSAVILYFFTSSFVRGFALTLFIGTLISMFSAITTTRLLLIVFLKNKQIKPKPEVGV